MALSRKQKILLPIIGVVLIILVWQLYLLLLGTERQWRLQQRQQLSLHQLNNTVPASPQNKIGALVNTQAQSVLPVSQDFSQADKVNLVQPMDTKLSAIDQESQEDIAMQHHYLALVRQYQIAQMKKLISQDYEAIATANQRAARAISATVKLHDPIKEKNLLAEDQGDQLINTSKTGEDEFQLIYTGQQAGLWNATIKQDDQLLDVNIGSTLSNGAKVVAINQNAVEVNDGRYHEKITFYGTLRRLREVHLTPAETTVTEEVPQKLEDSDVTKQSVAQNEKADQTKTVKKNPEKHDLKHFSVFLNEDLHHPKAVAPYRQLPLDAQRQALPPNSLAVNTQHQKVNKKPSKTVEKKIKTKRTPHKMVKRRLIKTPVLLYHLSRDEQDLLARNSHFYTIELVSSYHLDMIKRYLVRTGLEHKAYYYKTLREGKPYYILVYGQYRSAEDTLAAIAELPLPLQRWSPQVKSNLNVKSEIRRIA